MVFGDKKIEYAVLNMKKGAMIAVEGQLASYGYQDENGDWKSGLNVIVEKHWLLRASSKSEEGDKKACK